MKKTIRSISLILVFSLLFSMMGFASSAEESTLTLDEYGFVDVGDTSIEYGVYNKNASQAVLVLSGNGSDMHSLESNIIPELVNDYKVVCVSTRGTGQTALGTDHLTFEIEAQDLTRVLDYLNIDTSYVYGFSDGGNLALVYTLMYPERVTKLCVESPNINIFGTKTFTQIGFIIRYMFLCIQSRFNSDPEIIREREILGMMAHQPTLKFSDLKNISIPVLHIYAEHDMMFRTHSKMITKSIPDCKEIMIEDAGHSAALKTAPTIIGPALREFYGN